MLFEELFESLVHRHRIPQSMVEEEGRVILKRLHEALDIKAAEQRDTHSTERGPNSEKD